LAQTRHGVAPSASSWRLRGTLEDWLSNLVGVGKIWANSFFKGFGYFNFNSVSKVGCFVYFTFGQVVYFSFGGVSMVSCIVYFTFGLFNFGRAWPAKGSRTHWFLSWRWWDGSVLAGQWRALEFSLRGQFTSLYFRQLLCFLIGWPSRRRTNHTGHCAGGGFHLLCVAWRGRLCRSYLTPHVGG